MYLRAVLVTCQFRKCNAHLWEEAREAAAGVTHRIIMWCHHQQVHNSLLNFFKLLTCGKRVRLLLVSPTAPSCDVIATLVTAD
jgi:hypothetical protein